MYFKIRSLTAYRGIFLTEILYKLFPAIIMKHNGISLSGSR